MNEPLTSEQDAALREMKEYGHKWEVAVLEGVAGSGKTFTVDRFIEALGDDVRVAVACPTWKALSVVSQADGVDYSTVHSILGLRLKQLPGGKSVCVPEGKSRLHEYDIVIVDEASMIGPDLFSQLIKLENREGCSVLFVGDPMQLAPVSEDEDGVLSPVFSVVQERWRLNTVVRQAADNPIIQASVVVRQYIESGERLPLDVLGEALAKNGGAEKRMAGVVVGGGSAIVDLALDRINADDDTRILCYTNERVKRMNAAVHRRIYGSDNADTAGFAVGERIIMQEEFSTREFSLKNAEELTIRKIETAGEILGRNAVLLYLGRITADDDSTAFVVPVPVDRPALDGYVRQLFNEWRRARNGSRQEQDKALSCNAHAWQLLNTFANVRHAYASTIHKAQGSTYDTAIVDWQDCNKMRLDHEFNRAIYVAMTRPRSKLAVVGGRR